jgi:hypothetical protein
MKLMSTAANDQINLLAKPTLRSQSGACDTNFWKKRLLN